MTGSQRKTYFDWITLGIYLSLLTIGFFSVYSATSSYSDNSSFLDPSSSVFKQLAYLVAALVLFFVVQLIDGRFWHTFSYAIYGFGILSLIVVLIFGVEINGAKAWFNFGSYSFQPSELAKFGTVLSVSSYIAFYKVNEKLRYNRWIMLAIIFLPVLLILMQPDAGSALTFLSFFIVLYTEGFNPIIYFIFFLAATVFICAIIFPLSYVFLGVLLISIGFSSYYFQIIKWQWLAILFSCALIIYLFVRVDPLYAYILSSIVIIVELLLLWKNRNMKLAVVMPIAIGLIFLFAYSSLSVFSGLKEHQKERIKVWLKPSECDPRGSLYNILQSKVAIGSGGFFGKGFLNGNMTKLKYVPEQSTDFIFSTIGEEQGFLGSILVILLFVFLIWRMIQFAEESTNKFVSSFTLSLAGFLMTHFFINIGMTIGIVPIIGIPLPFISKGGSSLIIFSIMLGIFMRLQSRPL